MILGCAAHAAHGDGTVIGRLTEGVSSAPVARRLHRTFQL